MEIKKIFYNFECFFYNILADCERYLILKSLFYNLITNAIKYTPDNGQITIEWYTENKMAIFKITDNGIGIAKEHSPRLTERFYRVDKSRSREGGGTGLGLSIVKHIIEAHSQTIHARSTINVGTTLSFTLKKP